MSVKLTTVLFGCLFFLAGCGYSPGTRQEGAEFKGKLTDAAGRPIPNVSVILQPTFSGGLPSGGKVEKDGSFKGKAVPGDYVFSIGPVAENAKAMAFLKGINKKYLSPDAANKVSVAAGANLEIKLSN
ncbi:MAG: carboxypeptidase-like regulatory domain-containing protein [Planctomycetota bacterium]|jgi:hypothetical protein